ncbi:hypothetical protein ACFL2Q_07090 [Thermodesulfobacteriota bacterium]
MDAASHRDLALKDRYYQAVTDKSFLVGHRKIEFRRKIWHIHRISFAEDSDRATK